MHMVRSGRQLGSLLCAAALAGGAAPVGAQEPSPAVTVRLEMPGARFKDRFEGTSRKAPCGVRQDTLVTGFRPEFPSGITWFSLIVPNPLEATRGTGAFRLEMALVDPELGRLRHVIESRTDRPRRGSGAVTLTFDDPVTRAQFAVRTEGGVEMSGVLVCRGSPAGQGSR